MRLSPKLIAVVGVAALVAGILAAPAFAANAYNQTFLGQSQCVKCHYPTAQKWAVDYLTTRHGQFATNVESNTAALVPPIAKWPSPAYGTGLRFAATEIKWVLGAPGRLKEYVSIYKNNGPYTMASGQTIPTYTTGPADDLLMVNGAEWSSALNAWEMGANPVSGRPYFQTCGGCHHLGVTRPGAMDYPLASGNATQTHSTETTISGFGIQCENCHGTGVAASAETSGGHNPFAEVKIVRTKAVLKSQVCGQCHVNGAAKERNFGNTGFFGSANGYTPDKKLSDFYDAYGTVAPNDYVKGSRASVQPTIPLTPPVKFWPNGSNRSMHHSYYNEWVISPHARSLRYRNGDLWTPYAKDECLRCHSGEGFLKSIGYGATNGGNDIYWAESSVASDTLNIECSVCHTVHSKSGEALGLRMEGTELCSACHNGDIEEGNKAPLGKALHHTIREMFNGYGMIGVPDSTELFMEGTGCVDCHMPLTSGERMSHSFKVMTPGDAQAWGVQAEGDSCTPCHDSMTRSELQAKLDTWEADLTGRIAAVNAAVASAKSRPASATAGGLALIQSAEANRMFVEADGSGGGHNYPYAKAGLDKALEFAKAVGASYGNYGVTSFSPTAGHAVLYGTLRYGDGTPVAAKELIIQRRAVGSSAWSDYDTVMTSANGAFGLAVLPVTSHAGPGCTEYRVHWNAGVTGADVYSAVAACNIGSKTTVRSSRSTMALGYSAVISGAVAPNHAGSTVRVQVKRGTGAWATLSTRTLGATSAYSLTWKPRYRGTYYLRTIFSGDTSHTGSTSSTIAVKAY